MFDVNIVWFDINQEITSAVYWVQRTKGLTQKHNSEKGYPNPKSLVKDSIVDDTIVVVFHNNHYQYVKMK